MIQRAQRLSAETIVMTVKAFADEPDVLYVALDYAYESGVAITMAPTKVRGRQADGARWRFAAVATVS